MNSLNTNPIWEMFWARLASTFLDGLSNETLANMGELLVLLSSK